MRVTNQIFLYIKLVFNKKIFFETTLTNIIISYLLFNYKIIIYCDIL